MKLLPFAGLAAAVLMLAAASDIVLGNAAAQVAGQQPLTDSQKSMGCRQTMPNCFKVSKSRFVPGPRNPNETEIEVVVRNRCGQRVLARICFEHSDLDARCTYEALADRKTKRIRDVGLTKEYVEREDQLARQTGTYPPWGEVGQGAWATGRVSFAWIGIPNKGDIKWECRTDVFEDIEYDFGED